MSESPPPPLDYQTPPPEKSPWPRFIGGFVLGLLLIGGATFGGMVAAFGISYGQTGRDGLAWAAMILPPLLIVVLAVLLARSKSQRHIGIGMLVAVPVTLLTTFVLCGGMR